MENGVLVGLLPLCLAIILTSVFGDGLILRNVFVVFKGLSDWKSLLQTISH